jgi:hypothetical protein
MGWFTNKQKRLEMMQGIRATSKSSLKLQCLFCCKGDLKEAKELYNFFAEDLEDLPDNDPVPQTWQQNTAQTVNSLMAWLKENQGTLTQAYSFVQSIIANKGTLPALTAAEETVEALPNINE